MRVVRVADEHRVKAVRTDGDANTMTQQAIFHAIFEKSYFFDSNLRMTHILYRILSCLIFGDAIRKMRYKIPVQNDHRIITTSNRIVQLLLKIFY